MKTSLNFLQDMFDFFKDKYSKNKGYVIQVTNHHTVTHQFAIESSPNNNFKISLNLNNQTLELLYIVPKYIGDTSREEVLKVVLQINVSFNASKALWVIPQNSIGGISSVISFKKRSEMESRLILEILQKAHQLFYEEKYDFDQ